MWIAHAEKYLMATESSYPEPEIESSQPVTVSFQEALETELIIKNTPLLDFNDRYQMSGNASKKPHGFGSSWKNPESEWSSKYSHEDTRPEKIQERIEDLHHDMQDSLQRLQDLEAKLKNGAGKKRKRANQTDERKNAELQKALSDIMKDANENLSK